MLRMRFTETALKVVLDEIGDLKRRNELNVADLNECNDN